ncbi:MAG: hypothetical protein K1X51_14525 [Rhodospirillaceae bacterium]|nr:hypothetical protein [Rhodospirillaceae bacterium]
MLSRIAKFLTHQIITKRMAMSEVDIYRSAQDLVRRHGAAAEREADALSAAALVAGDEERATTWTRIAKSVRGILDTPAGRVN